MCGLWLWPSSLANTTCLLWLPSEQGLGSPAVGVAKWKAVPVNTSPPRPFIQTAASLSMAASLANGLASVNTELMRVDDDQAGVEKGDAHDGDGSDSRRLSALQLSQVRALHAGARARTNDLDIQTHVDTHIHTCTHAHARTPTQARPRVQVHTHTNANVHIPHPTVPCIHTHARARTSTGFVHVPTRDVGPASICAELAGSHGSNGKCIRPSAPPFMCSLLDLCGVHTPPPPDLPDVYHTEFSYVGTCRITSWTLWKNKDCVDDDSGGPVALKIGS